MVYCSRSRFTSLSTVSLQAMWGEYKCTVVGLVLLVCLQFLSRLRGRVQVYCNRSRFTSLSTVSLQATWGEYKCTVVGLGLLVCLQFLSRLRGRVQVYCSRSMFTGLSMVQTIHFLPGQPICMNKHV